ncbi:hypothetical protein [Parasitella parasitica]|uniref:RanBD1 domain-containing protein n=1 Tax=Parasitella parasitica TaxID=35722 RepID=A0A0B7NMV1_9FUNG|nr:hypothetical protein [Parasitella parasitica]
MSDKEEKKIAEQQEEEVESPDVHFEPIIKLEEVVIKTNEEEEDVLFKMRAKLFRHDKGTNEWKERGTGDVKLLQHRESKMIRLLMRRDKTHKVCANHYVTKDMKLAPNVGSDRAWVWKAVGDFAEDQPSDETLAIRFANSENANLFKEAFENAIKNNEQLKNKKTEKDNENKKEEKKEEKKEDA